MRAAYVVASAGFVCLAVSFQAFAKPPADKARTKFEASPFIQFPVPERSVGVIHQRALVPAGGNEVGVLKQSKKLPIELSLPAAAGGFPAMEKKPSVPECGAR